MVKAFAFRGVHSFMSASQTEHGRSQSSFQDSRRACAEENYRARRQLVYKRGSVGRLLHFLKVCHFKGQVCVQQQYGGSMA